MASEPRPDQPPPSPKTSGDAEPKAPPPRKAPLGLLGLTEEATLELLSRLDMVGLATVRRVCRRLHRIASDPSLLGRVSVVQWTGEGERGRPWLRIAGPWFCGPHSKNRFRTNCAQLGSVQMPEGAEGPSGAEKFLSLLEWLLAGGAEVVSLQMPGRGKGGHFCLPRLPSLLKKHKVELEALACLPLPAAAFLEVVRSQPTLSHLCLRVWSGRAYTDETEVAELVRCLPGLRHLSLMESSLGQRAHWVRPGLPVALAAQLRSVLLVSSARFFMKTLGGAVEGIREASAGRLLLRAVGFSGQGSANRRYAAFAVEDFRAEERGRQFLVKGKLGDPWDGARVALPDPTLDARLIQPFLNEVDRRQKAEERQQKRQKAEEERERLQKNKADGKMLKWEAKEESKTEAAKGTKTLVE